MARLTKKRITTEVDAFRAALLDTFDFTADPHKLSVVDGACSLLRRALEARYELDRDGVTVENRFGQRVPHPAALLERQSILAMTRALRDLDLEPPST